MVEPLSRKARRKQERAAKKLKRRPVEPAKRAPLQNEAGIHTQKRPEGPSMKKLKVGHKKKHKRKHENDAYVRMDPDMAAALKHDDQEIAYLEAQLGLADKKQKTKLNKEYSRLEGYGDDFGDFLDHLDSMVHRVTQSSEGEDGDLEREGKEIADKKSGLHMGRSGREDDGVDLSKTREGSDDELLYQSSDDSSEEDEEVIPMKEPAFDDLDEDDSVLQEIEGEDEAGRESDSDSDSDDSSSSSSSEDDQDRDHDKSLTYRPVKGEDIYGNKVESTEHSSKPTKYVPPHLRKKQDADESANDRQRQESLRQIQRPLNSALNRLSQDTMVSVAQEIAKLYPLHPTSDVNECIWKSTKNVCITRSHLMSSLIPVYMAALAGVHVIKSDSAQLGEFLMEKVVVDLWNQVKTSREKQPDKPDLASDDELVSKEPSNLMLSLCYLYNFGIVHCSLLYDVVRDLIQSFTEIDIELLLLILSHCGRALRSDDPSALKEIVLLVQKRALETKDKTANSSRVDYMITAIMDLKNNKRRKQDSAHFEKMAKLRKSLGQIKSNVASSNGGFRSESSLRISLSDLLQAESKGRFWKVGASWVGNQYQFQEGADGEEKHIGGERAKPSSGSSIGHDSQEDSKLLKLATKYRMNTDIRRSIFCIIMGSADCDDAFEKLVRAKMLKSRTERETVRVLMECCGNEKSFNKYYSHLASRICEFQPQCKFSFQLAFWDAFKVFDDMKPRKAANLAKLLFQLVVVHFSLRLNVLKAIDMSSPEELSETAMIFLTIFLSNLMDHFDDESELVRLIETSIKDRKRVSTKTPDTGENDLAHMDDGDALRASLTVFLVKVLKKSPRYKKGSKFRANLKATIKACDVDNFF